LDLCGICVVCAWWGAQIATMQELISREPEEAKAVRDKGEATFMCDTTTSDAHRRLRHSDTSPSFSGEHRSPTDQRLEGGGALQAIDHQEPERQPAPSGRRGSVVPASFARAQASLAQAEQGQMDAGNERRKSLQRRLSQGSNLGLLTAVHAIAGVGDRLGSRKQSMSGVAHGADGADSSDTSHGSPVSARPGQMRRVQSMRELSHHTRERRDEMQGGAQTGDSSSNEPSPAAVRSGGAPADGSVATGSFRSAADGAAGSSFRSGGEGSSFRRAHFDTSSSDAPKQRSPSLGSKTVSILRRASADAPSEETPSEAPSDGGDVSPASPASPSKRSSNSPSKRMSCEAMSRVSCSFAAAAGPNVPTATRGFGAADPDDVAPANASSLDAMLFDDDDDDDDAREEAARRRRENSESKPAQMQRWQDEDDEDSDQDSDDE
jgi:hypothetical protein